MKMIKLLSFLLLAIVTGISAFAQPLKNYEAQWKKINELIKKSNLPKSALEEVNKLYLLAKKEGQQAQVIKSLVYKTQLQQGLEEDADQNSIALIEKEIPLQKEPAVALLKNLLANKYWSYFRQHRWQLYNRTATVNFKKEDLATWGVEDFHRKISALFLQSLSPAALLKNTSLASYDALLVKGNARALRPTLYDVLAHQALEYFLNDERNIKKPAYAFEIDQPEAFAPAAQFAAARFTTKDSLSLEHKALLIYQDLIRFHLTDKDPAALIDVDLHRLQFVVAHATHENKNELHRKALQELYDRYQHSPKVAQGGYLLALYHHTAASSYHPLKDTSNRFARVEAKKILEEILRDSTQKNEGWINSYNLLQEITRPNFSFQLEKVNVPGQHFRALLTYRAVNNLYFRLIKNTDELKNKAAQGDEKYWDALWQEPTVRNWQQTLPATNDYQQHSVEIKIDALEPGAYILLASDEPEKQKNSLLGAHAFFVSNISFIQQGNAFYVLHRESGQPLSQATVDVYEQRYNYNSNKYEQVRIANYKTDKSGSFSLDKSAKNYNNYFLDIKHGNERLYLDQPVYVYHSNEPGTEKKTTKPDNTFFFTDRAIYRPGQTLYFKGIVLEAESGKNSVVANAAKTIYLRNANYELTDSITLTTNEFGSFNGKFVLPQNVLNGFFQLTDKNSRNSVAFRVEEYKRPKFQVSFDKIKNTYRAGDNVTVEGRAEAYAGNNIDGAKVVYRVVRKPRFIYPWLFRRWWQPPTESMEILHGETITDKNGKFQVSFTAVPDKKIDKKFAPVFDYFITADVTDINGETRSKETIVSAGYQSLLLRVDIPNKIETDSLKQIGLRTENMNAQFQPAMVSVIITSLVPEKRLLRKRYWEQPDQFLFTKEEYSQLFPHDEYKNETDWKNWPIGAVAYSINDSSRADGRLPISQKLAPGFYQIAITTKDKNGEEIKAIDYFELFDPNNLQLTAPVYLWTKESKPIEPGEKTNVQIGSAAQEVFVIYQKDQKTTNDQRKTTTEILSLSQEKKNLVYSASEADRGGYGLSFAFVKDNRFYTYNETIQVPWTNKELNISFGTFRDKTLPGANEKWTLKISGKRGEKVAAELLASMYDASLDQFVTHDWRKPSVWRNYYSNLSWQHLQNFSAVLSYQVWKNEPYRYFDKTYDRLITAQQDYDRVYNQRIVTRSMVEKGEMQEVVANAATRKEAQTTADQSMQTDTATIAGEAPGTIKKDEPIQIRKNFQETAFFFPELKTEKDGSIEFSFTAPEALTRWKLQALAHTKDAAFGLQTKELTTQKELMLQTNAPRFLRQGDELEFSTKLVNLSEKELTGQVELQLFDASTNQSVDGWFINSFPNQYFTVGAGESISVNFPIQVPYQFTQSLLWRIVARSNADSATGISLTDGEEMILPVLTNKILVTETLPLPIRGSGTKNFRFDKLINANSESLLHQAFTIEFTSNPAWYAVQALPYLAEAKNESVEQTFNRFYAQALAASIVRAAPRIQQIMERWKNADSSALLSQLQKNQELKSALLEETPWVLEAKTEAQRKRNIALLFDLVRMNSELTNAFKKLKEMQASNGGFVWFKGSPDDRYTTQYIVTGLGHLKKLNALPDDASMNQLLQSAVLYLDRKMKTDYDQLIKNKVSLKQQQVGPYQVQYLYMRSFFPEQKIAPIFKTAYDFYSKQAQQFWMKGNQYQQGMTALFLHRSGDKQTPADILRSLKETAINNEELGMYWKENRFGYSWHWWNAPIETQSLLIEAFAEISKDQTTVDNLKTWLLKNKQTSNWHTGKATADACFALLLQGSDWLQQEPTVQIKAGSININNNDQKTEAGTGYFKKSFEGRTVTPSMGNITVSVQQPGEKANTLPTWGAAYWQYFEDMDKITAATTPLQLNKKLFLQKNTDRGPVLSPVTNETELHVGDQLKVRIELRVDRDMDYVHMKDLRASALEPVNVLSSYKWQGGLGYYETTKDASTSFFFPYLRKGVYVFEYPVFVSHSGQFSNGITTIQSLYAPEFSAHSEGVRLRIE